MADLTELKNPVEVFFAGFISVFVFEVASGVIFSMGYLVGDGKYHSKRQHTGYKLFKFQFCPLLK